MQWYQKTAILVGLGFLAGAMTVNLLRIIIIEHNISRVLPHLGVWIFLFILIIPVILRSREWFS